MDAEQIRALVEASSKAAVEAAIAAMQQTSISKRKPDLPDFDKRNIDIWIKRVESAYTRSNVVSPKEKFAHLEAKIGVEVDPKINEFLYGTATDDTWIAFLDYLRERYGRSKRQQAAVILDGVKRECRRPSQLLSVIKERSANVSIDDLQKELVLRELPEEIQRVLISKIDDYTAQELADAADKHFDKDGRPLLQTTPTTSSVSFSRPFAEESAPPSDEATSGPVEGQINASFRPPQRRQHSFSSRGRGNSRGNSRGNGRGGQNSSSSKEKPKHTLCTYHERFGEKAYKCEAPCLMQSKDAPKAQPGQRA